MTHVLDPLVAFDPDGGAVRLGTLWADRTAVLVFVRHFGCLFCRQQLAGLGLFLGRFQSLGADLIIIGSGSVEEARAFRDEGVTPIPILTDPSRQSFTTLQMRRGLASVLAPGVLMRSLGALRAGFRQSRVAGDPLQQGGVVAIAPGGVERFRFISRNAGDHPAPLQILDAIRVIP